MLLGILLLSIACLETGRTYLGALLFCLLLCMKHIFLYVSPVFFVYLLRFHCHLKFRPFKLDLGALLRLAFVVLGTFIACLLPIFWTGKPLETLLQLLRRLFPFGRGLTHAYWAPNAWAFYNTLDRVLAKVLRVSGGGSTAGFAEVYESAVLWTVPPKATFVLTLLAYCPLLWKIWQAKDRHGLAIYVTLGSAIAFTFGWHVHEKAILMVTIPFLAALPALPHDWDSIPLRHCAVGLSTVACFSVMPLLPLTPLETVLKWILFAVGLPVEEVLLGSKAVSLKMLGVGFLPWQLVVLGYCLLGLYRDAGGHQLLFRQRMEFLPLLLTSDFSAMLVLQFFWSIFRLLPSGKSPRPCGRAGLATVDRSARSPPCSREMPNIAGVEIVPLIGGDRKRRQRQPLRRCGKGHRH
eukprot:symbB.v1.2.020099.t1/scaffold1638.1/size107986/4